MTADWQCATCGMWQSFNRPDYSVSEATERRGPCGRVLGNVLGAVAPVTLGLVPLVPPTLHSCTFQLPPSYIYIFRRFTTGSPIDGTHWLPNKEMTKLWEVSDETSISLYLSELYRSLYRTEIYYFLLPVTLVTNPLVA